MERDVAEYIYIYIITRWLFHQVERSAVHYGRILAQRNGRLECARRVLARHDRRPGAPRRRLGRIRFDLVAKLVAMHYVVVIVQHFRGPRYMCVFCVDATIRGSEKGSLGYRILYGHLSLATGAHYGRSSRATTRTHCCSCALELAGSQLQ